MNHRRQPSGPSGPSEPSGRFVKDGHRRKVSSSAERYAPNGSNDPQHIHRHINPICAWIMRNPDMPFGIAGFAGSHQRSSGCVAVSWRWWVSWSLLWALFGASPSRWDNRNRWMKSTWTRLDPDHCSINWNAIELVNFFIWRVYIFVFFLVFVFPILVQFSVLFAKNIAVFFLIILISLIILIP